MLGSGEKLNVKFQNKRCGILDNLHIIWAEP